MAPITRVHGEIRLARREAVSQAISQLQSASAVAVSTLKDISGNRVLPAGARVSAARTILDMAIKGIEIEDLVERVGQLELQLAPQRLGSPLYRLYQRP